MPELTFLQWANALKGYALALGIVFSIIMIVIWWRHSQELLRVRNKIEANQIYAAYILVAEKFRSSEAELDDADACVARLHFAALLLATCNTIFLLDPAGIWRTTLRAQLVAHRPLLIVLLSLHEGPPLDNTVREFVDQTIKSASGRGE